jgi:hypothetical protein
MGMSRSLSWIILLPLVAPVLSMHGQDKAPLKLIQKIPLPNVKGRIDHMDVDVRGKRLFVAGLENGTLEVVDLKAAKRAIRSKFFVAILSTLSTRFTWTWALIA